MERCLFVGDSLGLPRPQCNVRYEGTTIGKLSERYNMWILSHTGATATEFEKILIELSHILPEDFFTLAVIQLGLSDCAPRPLDSYWRGKLSKLKPKRLRSFIVKIIHRYRPFIQSHIGYYQRTKYPKFQESFDRVLKLCSVLSNKTVVIPIPPIRDSLEEHSPKLREEIGRYNLCMKKLAKRYNILIADETERLSSNPLVYLTDDGHLTEWGNKVVIGGII